MKSSANFHWTAWVAGLVALLALGLVACGGAAATPVVVEKEVVKEVIKEVVVEKEVLKEVPKEVVVEKEVIRIEEKIIVATAVPSAKATAVPTPTPGALASAKDTLRFVTNEEPHTLGAAGVACNGNTQQTICDDIASDPLTWVDGKSFEVVPLQGFEGWSQEAPDRWRFKLRDGVVFHNGAPWTVEAAKFWIDWYGDEETAGHNQSNVYGFHGPISGEVVDPMTVDVVCKNPCPILPKTTIFTDFQDVAWFEQASEDDIESMTVGLGPYRIVEWRRGVSVELEAFEDYKPNTAFDAQAPSIQHAFQLFRNEPLVRAAMIEAGEADWAEIPMQERNRVPKFEVATNNEVYIYAIDTIYHPELRKAKVREALNLAIDCDLLMEQIFEGLMECYGNSAQPGTVGITPENSAPYPYDPDRARELLKEAGYDPANKITLNQRNNRIPRDVEYGEAVVTMWRDVGINAEQNVVESKTRSNISYSNCGHGRTKEDIANAAGATLEEKCRSLGPGKPTFASMNLTETATSTESLDMSRQGGLRASCYSRSSGVCEDELQKKMEAASAADMPERRALMEEIATHVRDHFHFVPNFQNVVVYGTAADLEWEPYYAPRLRINTWRFK